MEVPDIKFTRSGDVDLAYQRWGTGPDVVVIPPLVSNIEIMWENELWRRALEFNGQHARTLEFDKAGHRTIGSLDGGRSATSRWTT